MTQKRAPLFGVLLGLVASIPLLLLAIASGGAGHGNYFWAKILFPFTMLSTSVFQSITFPFIVLAIIQFPAYGFLIGRQTRQGNLIKASAIVILVHLVALGFTFFFTNRNFG